MSITLNYADYNFSSVVSQLRTILSSDDEIWDSYESSTATMLIELFAYVGEMLMYTAERRAQESFLPTAQLKSSVIALVRLLNYQPARVISSTGTLTFTLSSPNSVNIYIPKYTRCTRSDSTQFLTATDCILLAGSTSVSVDGIQGKNIPFSFVSNGQPFQSYTINDTKVENSHLFVLGGTWTQVSSFVTSVSNSQVYKAVLNNDETVTLDFGDNIFGMIPAQNSTVSGNYIQSVGSSGNVFSTGQITTLLDTITDENGAIVTLSVTNSTTFLGGADAEDIESIRYNAPRIFATADRDVTKNDYIADIENYPSVASVNVWGEAESNPPNITMLNQIVIAMILDGWNLAGTTFKQQISNYLQTRAQMTVQYNFVDPTIVQLNVIVNAVTSQSNSLATVETGISNALTSEFALGNVGIAVPVRYSDVMQTIENVSGVLYSFLQLQLQQTIGTGDGVKTSFSDTLQLTNVLDSSVQVYKNSSLIGYSTTADGSSVATDRSPWSLALTMNGAYITTKYAYLGTGSAKFNGINAYISTPTHIALNLSNGIWTYDIAVNPDVLMDGTLYFHSTDANNYFRIYTTPTGAVGIKIVSGGVTNVNISTPASQIVVGKWTHLEFSENGTTYQIFVNGSPITTSTSVYTPGVYTGQAEIGRDGSLGHYFSGYIDEVLLSKGIQRNSVNFTPPTTIYTSDSYTSLLTHLDGRGNIVAVNGSQISGTIDYALGTIAVNFVNPPANLDSIVATYGQSESNYDLIPGKQQIIRLINTDVTVTYPAS